MFVQAVPMECIYPRPLKCLKLLMQIHQDLLVQEIGVFLP